MNQKKINIIRILPLTASMVLTVYEYPTFATSKLHLVFFLLLGGILWFYQLPYVLRKCPQLKDGKMGASSAG